MSYNPDSANDDFPRFLIDKATSDNRIYMDSLYTAVAGLRTIQQSGDDYSAARATKTLETMFKRLLASGEFE